VSTGQICKSTISATRSKLTELFVFSQLFSEDTRDWLVQQLNKNVAAEKPHSANHGGAFTADIILELALTLLLPLVNGYTSWGSFKEMKDRVGVKKRMIDRFIKYLNIPWETFFTKVNNDLKYCVQLNGRAAGDETMWGWKGDDPATVHLERKPVPDGFKVISMAIEMTRTKR
jgi:hypothetical protein